MAVYTGRDSLIELSTNGTTFIAIPQVETIKPPDEKHDEDTIHLLDATSEYAEKVATGLSCSNITATVAYDPTNETHRMLDALASTPFNPEDILYVRITHTANGEPETYRCSGVNKNAQEVSRRAILRREYEFLTVCPIQLSSSS